MKTSSGDVRLDTTGPLKLTASHGSITVDRIEGMAEITTSSGSLRVGLVDGPAVLKNSHGTTTVGAATGELRVSDANGDIEIRRARAGRCRTPESRPVAGHVARYTDRCRRRGSCRGFCASWLRRPGGAKRSNRM